ncbi:MAG: alkaline phosphatase family protein [Candidatus Baldrarchaeia archaeon]
MKLVVIGLDGAHWELIYPWIEEGSLSNISRIISHGVWGDMLSCLPPVTLPNWKCYSTGKNPGKIGIFWWENIDFNHGRIYHPFHRKFLNKEIWDYLSEAGYRVGVIGVPGTYPPKKVNGFMIAGGPDAEEKGFTYPRDLEKRIKDEYDYKLRPETPISLDKDKASREIKDIIDVKFRVAKTLADEYQVDFLQVTSFEINTMHHFLWNDERTKECWKIIDHHIHDFLKDGETNVMLVSDHGSNEIRTVFNINTWLEKRGYLRTSTRSSGLLYRLGITQELLSKALRRLGLKKLAKKVPKNIVGRIPSSSGEIEKRENMIDWEKSRAIASGQGPIYLKAKNEEEKSKLLIEIKKELEELVSPITGERIVNKVYLKQDIYSGKYLDEAPDLIIDQAKGIHIPGGIGMKEVFSTPKRWRAENKKWGLFAAYGPGIKSGEKVKISILDLAPTILYMFNTPVPPDMDGKVLTEIFKEEPKVVKRRVSYQEMDEKKKIRERIRELRKLSKI